MFTGLIQEVGSVISRSSNREGMKLKILAPLSTSKLKIDDSVAIDGACQTVIEIDAQKQWFVVQAIHVTLEKTNFSLLKDNQKVNLELALQVGSYLGGHFVQGHVNGVSTIQSISSRGENYLIRLSTSPELLRYLVSEGSIALNGVSLTLAEVDYHAKSFMVSLIPHTWAVTNWQHKKYGDILNVEVDLFAKYAYEFFTRSSAEKKKDSLIEFLKGH